MTGEQLLVFVRQIDTLAESALDDLVVTVSAALVGKPLDSLEEIRGICEAVERDILSDLMAPRAA